MQTEVSGTSTKSNLLKPHDTRTSPRVFLLAQAEHRGTGYLHRQWARWHFSFSGQKGIRILLTEWPVASSFCVGSSLGAKQLELTNTLLQGSATPDYEPLPVVLHSLLPHTILPMFWNFCMKLGTHNLHCGCNRHTDTPKHTVQIPQ